MNYDFYEDIDVLNKNQGYYNMSNNVDFLKKKSSNNETSYQEFDILKGSVNQNYQDNNKLNLYNPYEGYLRGNAFKNEYMPYKNYRVAKLNINNEKDELLVDIGQYSFMMHDVNLYLDVHPNNREALNKFIEYQNMVNDLITKYERKYGPLCVKGNISNNIPFEWENTSWPWVN